MGFVGAAALLLLMRVLIRSPQLYSEPKDDRPPPWWIRGILIFTCTCVSFAHGGNDGQKGMGLIMLILIGVAPTAYALNRTMPDNATPGFLQSATAAQQVFTAHAGNVPTMTADAARKRVGDALRDRDLNHPDVFAALSVLSQDIANQVKNYGSISHVPAVATPNVRNDMYLAADSVRLMTKADVKFTAPEAATLKTYQSNLQAGTRFIPDWVKVAVAIALGLGTMVGWKRIVVTVGEKIGKTHLTYAQGAAAEIIAAVTIGGAELYGLPVSTTHVLSSGVAGTMAANHSGLQWSTVRSIALAWVMTLPAAMALAGILYWILRQVV
jgi:PiT family inorganic phosphate transporter